MADRNPKNIIQQGEESHRRWQEGLWENPEYQAVYEEEAAKSELWLQLAEARQQAGLTQKQMAERLGVSQAQVARIEKRGYNAYTLNTLRRYVKALGEGYALEVRIRKPEEASDEFIRHAAP